MPTEAYHVDITDARKELHVSSVSAHSSLSGKTYARCRAHFAQLSTYRQRQHSEIPPRLHTEQVCVLRGSPEQTAIISLYSIN